MQNLIRNKYPFIDVESLNELPSITGEYKYIDFIGGTKELRCFLVPSSHSRSAVMNDIEDFLDSCLLPILSCDGIVVRQDTSFAMPGFYIIGLPEEYKSIDQLDDRMTRRLSEIIKAVRKAMRSQLDIQQIHLRCEEKLSTSYVLHYWMLPIGQHYVPQSIIDRGVVREYLSKFRFSKNSETIRSVNALMRDELRNFYRLELP